MGLVWRLVETRTGSWTRGADVLEISQASQPATARRVGLPSQENNTKYFSGLHTNLP